jgi:hypothetical protein
MLMLIKWVWVHVRQSKKIHAIFFWINQKKPRQLFSIPKPKPIPTENQHSSKKTIPIPTDIKKSIPQGCTVSLRTSIQIKLEGVFYSGLLSDTYSIGHILLMQFKPNFFFVKVNFREMLQITIRVRKSVKNVCNDCTRPCWASWPCWTSWSFDCRSSGRYSIRNPLSIWLVPRRFCQSCRQILHIMRMRLYLANLKS